MELLYTDQPLHKNKIEKKSIQKEKVVMIIKEKRNALHFKYFLYVELAYAMVVTENVMFIALMWWH